MVNFPLESCYSLSWTIPKIVHFTYPIQIFSLTIHYTPFYLSVLQNSSQCPSHLTITYIHHVVIDQFFFLSFLFLLFQCFFLFFKNFLIFHLIISYLSLFSFLLLFIILILLSPEFYSVILVYPYYLLFFSFSFFFHSLFIFFLFPFSSSPSYFFSFSSFSLDFLTRYCLSFVYPLSCFFFLFFFPILSFWYFFCSESMWVVSKVWFWPVARSSVRYKSFSSPTSSFSTLAVIFYPWFLLLLLMLASYPFQPMQVKQSDFWF